MLWPAHLGKQENTTQEARQGHSNQRGKAYASIHWPSALSKKASREKWV